MELIDDDLMNMVLLEPSVDDIEMVKRGYDWLFAGSHFYSRTQDQPILSNKREQVDVR